MRLTIFSDKSYQVVISAFSKEEKEVECSSVFRVGKDDTVEQEGETLDCIVIVMEKMVEILRFKPHPIPKLYEITRKTCCLYR
jgi:hypothetical protein